MGKAGKSTYIKVVRVLGAALFHISHLICRFRFRCPILRLSQYRLYWGYCCSLMSVGGELRVTRFWQLSFSAACRLYRTALLLAFGRVSHGKQRGMVPQWQAREGPDMRYGLIIILILLSGLFPAQAQVLSYEEVLENIPGVWAVPFSDENDDDPEKTITDCAELNIKIQIEDRDGTLHYIAQHSGRDGEGFPPHEQVVEQACSTTCSWGGKPSPSRPLCWAI